jgi:hypothetical protein
MPNKIKIKRSYTPGASPLTTDLETHECAANWNDGKLFVKQPDGTLRTITLGGGGGGSSSSIVEYATAAGFPATGASQTLYISTDANRVYRWAGSVYVEIGTGGVSLSVAITSQPTNQTASSGAATFSVTASLTPSGGTLTYQWERSDDGGATFAAVSGATSATLALTGLTNASDDNDRYRVVVSAVGAESVTSNAATLTVASSSPPLSLAGTRPSNLASGTTSNGYTLTGTGTSGSPSVLMIGGGNNNDYRVWLVVNQSGTLNWTVTASSEEGYDGGRLYSHSGPANYTGIGYDASPPAGYTAISNWRSGTQTQTGTTSVTAGQHIVLQWVRDDGGDAGNNRIELSAYIA